MSTDNLVFITDKEQKVDTLVDLFCGCGGSGGGLLDANEILGREVRGTFVNHWDKAVQIHQSNHPEHRHLKEDIFMLNPEAVFPQGTDCSLMWASPACFTKEALVTTVKGQVPIFQVRAGDLVLTHKGRWRPVVATFCKLSPTVFLKGHGHYGLQTTAEHPFYSKRVTHRYPGKDKDSGKRPGKKRALVENPCWPKASEMPSKLWATPYNVECLPMPLDHGLTPNSAFFYMLGRWLGDGSVSKSDLCICCGFHEVDELRNRLVKLIDASDFNAKWRERAGDTAHVFSLGNADLVRFVTREFGSGAKNKQIAPWVYGLPVSWQEALIDGYLDADGHTPDTGRNSCMTVSKKLAVGMKLLLSRKYAVSMRCELSRETEIDGRMIKGGSSNYILSWQPDNSKETSFSDSLHRFTYCKELTEGKALEQVFNIQVQDDESYVVDGIVVHNCTFFSVARGASCVNEQDRSHAHSVTDWVRHLNPEALLVENVAEFLGWGAVIQKRYTGGKYEGQLMWALNAKPIYPEFDEAHPSRTLLPAEHLQAEGETEAAWSERMLALGYQRYEIPDPNRKGEYFDAWVSEMRDLGYEVDHRILCSADYGDPTIRKRLFIYCVRRDTGKRIVWPEAYAGEKGKPHGRPMNWRTARDIIDWSKKGDSVFTRKKGLAKNTFRRLAIGLVKYGLREFLVSSAHGSPSPSDCDRRVFSPDEPLKTLTAKGERGIVQPEVAPVSPYVLPQHAGHQKDYVKSVDHPVSAITCNHRGEGLVQPSVAMLDHQRGTGVVAEVDSPLRTITAGGSHQALAEAFMMAIDQTGGTRGNSGAYPVDSPMRTLVTKNNQACIQVELEELSDRFLSACDKRGVDTSRATMFLGFLIDELKKHGKIDAKPWIYVYYSNGSEGKAIDEPLPAVRTKAGHALVYPVIEFDGKFVKIDLFYRMLNHIELQRGMGFPDDMNWAGCTQEEIVRAIGNSVSRGVSRALGLAWYSQDANVWEKVKHLYGH